MSKIRLLWLLSATLLIFATTGVLFLWLTRSEDIFKMSSPIKEEEQEDLSYLKEIYLAEDDVLSDSDSLSNQETKMLFFGDVMLDRHIGELLVDKKIDQLLYKLIDNNLFKDQDIISINLEGAVTNNGAHYAPDNLYDFSFAPQRIKEMQDYGFNYFNLANNHFSDQGDQGVIETRNNLNKLEVYYSGTTDAKIDEYSRRDIMVSGHPIAMLGFSMVYNNFDLEAAKKLVSIAALESDFVVVNIHWGNEYEHDFNVYQQSVGHALIDAGTDIIIGHHPHVVQGMEIYNNKPIFYSLGNFIFDQYFTEATQEGLAVSLKVSEENMSIVLLPFKALNSVPDLMSESEKRIFLEKFVIWSELAEDIKEKIKSGSLILTL